VALEREKADLAAATDDLGQRLRRPMASCPSCHAAVTGENVLLSATCPACQASLLTLFGKDNAQMREADFILLVGAIGLLLALTIWQAKQAA
jgi:Zn finger protein HypA/HybF involved in hydrogenase expression